MATIQQDNEQQNYQNPSNSPTTGGTSATGTSPGPGAGGASSNQQPVSPVSQNIAPQNGAGYTDVSAYLNANPQGGQNLGNQVASNLTNQYNTTQQGISTSANAANQSVNSGYTPENTQLIQQVADNPTQAVSNPNQVLAYQAQLNDTYAGPGSWTDLGTQQGNVASAQQYGNLLNTPGGSNVLTQQVEQQLNPGQTSQGINALDTLLFTGNPNAVQTAQTAATPYASLTDYLNQANTGVQNNIAQAQTNAAKTSQDALNAFTGQNGTLTNLNNTINNTTANNIANAQAQQRALNVDIANLYGGVAQDNTPTTLKGYNGATTPWGNTTSYNVGTLSPQDLSALGITSDQAKQLLGAMQTAGNSEYFQGHNFGAGSPTSQIDLSQWLNEQNPATAINAGNTATPQQYAEMAAIQQLLGSQTPTGNAINPLNASMAGTAPTNINNFDYNTALQNAQNIGNQERAAGAQEASALTSQADLAHAQSQHHGGFLGSVSNFLNNNPLSSVLNPPLALGKQTLKKVK